MKLEFTVQTKIKRPIELVFEAVTQPQHLNRYFTQTSSGPLRLGSAVEWSWSNLPKPQPVIVKELISNQKIVFLWQASGVSYNTKVTMTFETVAKNETLVRIHEEGWESDQSGLKSSYDHCSGWENMGDSLKAYLEFGIDIRNASVSRNSEGFLRMYSPVVPVNNLEKSNAWYQKHLGFKTIFAEPELIALDVGNGSACFSIMKFKDEQSLDAATRRRFEVCFEVKDTQSLHAKLTEAGVKTTKIVTQMDRYQVFEFFDLDENRLSVFEDKTGTYKAEVRSPSPL